MVVSYILIAQFAIPYLPEKYLNSNDLSIISEGMILVPALVYLFATGLEPVKDIRIRPLPVSTFVMIIFFAWTLIPLIAFVNNLSMMFAKNYVSDHLSSLEGNAFWINLVLVAVLPAMVEEFVFRGILFNGYRDSVIIRAAVASALLFGLFHMNVNQFSYAFVVGILFALLYEATGSLLASVTMHFTINAHALVVQRLLTAYQEYVTKMAEKDPAYEEAAKRLADSEAAKTATVSVAERLAAMMPLLLMALFFSAIAFWLLKRIAIRSGRWEHLKRLCSRNSENQWTAISVRDVSKGEVCGVETPEGYNGSREYGGRITGGVFWLSAAICVVMMIL